MPLLKTRPCHGGHAPLPLTEAEGSLLWSCTESDPQIRVSKPTFCVESESICLGDLNQPSSLSKMTFVTGQAKTGPKRLGLWRGVTFQGLAMEISQWVDNAQLATVLGGSADCRVRVPLLKSRRSPTVTSPSL
jgi:hypothetical protein